MKPTWRKMPVGVLVLATACVSLACIATVAVAGDAPAATAGAAAPSVPKGEHKSPPVGMDPQTLLKTLIFSINAQPEFGKPPLKVEFSVDLYDDDVTKPTYTWNFGDGSPESHDAKTTHTYKKSGEYNVTLKITDAKDRAGTDETEIDVEEPEGN